MLNFLCDLFAREDPDPGCRKFDRQGYPSDELANADYLGLISLGKNLITTNSFGFWVI